jgi:hypothetical protein
MVGCHDEVWLGQRRGHLAQPGWVGWGKGQVNIPKQATPECISTAEKSEITRELDGEYQITNQYPLFRMGVAER